MFVKVELAGARNTAKTSHLLFKCLDKEIDKKKMKQQKINT